MPDSTPAGPLAPSPRRHTEDSKRRMSEVAKAHWAAHPRPRLPLIDRLFRHREIAGDHWLWTGSLNNVGYPILTVEKRTQYVHRLAYEALVGPIPDGLHIDHLCRTPRCFNPDHLEPVTPQVNVLRGMAPSAITARTGVCQRGHRMTPENTYIRPDGSRRQCRECIRLRKRKAWGGRNAA